MKSKSTSTVTESPRAHQMPYRRVGRSGLKMPEFTLSFGHSFGKNADPEHARGLVVGAFERGVASFDLANHFGPPSGAAEKLFGKIFKKQLKSHREEMIVSTRIGGSAWGGYYGSGGSRKHILSAVDRSLKRLGVDYIDLLYHEGADPETPAEETARALADLVEAGKVVYLGVSDYGKEAFETMADHLSNLGRPLIAVQLCCSLFERTCFESGIVDAMNSRGVGGIAASPLAHGLLTGEFLSMPTDEIAKVVRAKFLPGGRVTEHTRLQILALNALADKRGQNLAGLALNWVLRHSVFASVAVGVGREEHILSDIEAIESPQAFSDQDLNEIDRIVRAVGQAEPDEAEEFSSVAEDS